MLILYSIWLDVNVFKCHDNEIIFQSASVQIQSREKEIFKVEYPQNCGLLDYENITQCTLVKFSKISRASSYCQWTSYRKWAVLCKMQKFQHKSAENVSLQRKFAEYDQRDDWLHTMQSNNLKLCFHFPQGHNQQCIFASRCAMQS